MLPTAPPVSGSGAALSQPRRLAEGLRREPRSDAWRGEECGGLDEVARPAYMPPRRGERRDLEQGTRFQEGSGLSRRLQASSSDTWLGVV
jgi:hypothetical protein